MKGKIKKSKLFYLNNKQKILEKKKIWVKKNPQKSKCNNIIYKKVKMRDLPPAKSNLCKECGKEAKVYHHPDYSKTLYIIPLCNNCHMDIHSRLRKEFKII